MDLTLIQSSLSVDEASLRTSTGLQRMDMVFQPSVHNFVSGLHRGLDCLMTMASVLHPERGFTIHPSLRSASWPTRPHCNSVATVLPHHFGIAWIFYCRLAVTMLYSLSVVLLLLYSWYKAVILQLHHTALVL